MIYVIDANNLAGKLNILKQNDFDKKLIKIIKKFFFKKIIKVLLVFDSADPMGDKYQDNNITVIYAPQDDYCGSADAKIIELVEQYVGASHQKDKKQNKKSEFADQIIVVSDDIEIKKAVLKISEKYDQKIFLQSAFLFAGKINDFLEKQKTDNNITAGNERGLDYSEVKKINKELLKFWK